MTQCAKCLENRWTFRKLEREVFATCQGCGNETSFPHVPKSIRKNWAARRACEKAEVKHVR